MVWGFVAVADVAVVVCTGAAEVLEDAGRATEIPIRREYISITSYMLKSLIDKTSHRTMHWPAEA